MVYNYLHGLKLTYLINLSKRVVDQLRLETGVILD